MGSKVPDAETTQAIWIAKANIDRFRDLLESSAIDADRQKTIRDLMMREEATLKRLSAE
ncbi:MAG: hypothetical protein J0G99_04740 [Alphaproteobacteria bacterium]|mgnify:CR=1 FL=1|nr:hypothetical protein [Alphaproteobacteria bacterium]